MTIPEIVKTTTHRPWPLPPGSWTYYQEWNDALFLHWKVDGALLRKRLPATLEPDAIDGDFWVSLVAFSMEKIRPKYLPYFPPVSSFHEVNIRTYVKYKEKPGVYFLSIEAANPIATFMARKISGLPYRYSKMIREKNRYMTENNVFHDKLDVTWTKGRPFGKKTALDHWLTERYALFQDTTKAIIEYDIHHVEWPVYDVDLQNAIMSYPRFQDLLGGPPDRTHYSPGVQVLAWKGKKYNI
ncbi:MAG: DUF2071 domain-containing protein [Cyclobacteriaceae bacterium]|nr:DUF2071 domain-containing protein [Cyclobacteriaceae bacterium]